MKLYAEIPNVEYEGNGIELGKQRSSEWEFFNNYWFGEGRDGGMISGATLSEMISETRRINNLVEDKLYNLDALEDMAQFAFFHEYFVYFQTY